MLNGHTELPNGELSANRVAEDVGILAMEIYVPNQYVEQAELEKHDQVREGKYTIGLGQEAMAFCTDLEDIVSVCMTAVYRLMKNYNLSYKDIGRLEVGTETLIDKSKSVKSHLMKLFDESGNYDVEGADCINACYGGTNAFFNAVNWVESKQWDGRNALVVAGDIAIYEPSTPARSTGGAGAVAVLIGPNANIIIKNNRSSYSRHAYDFYKPNMASEYPIVDGALSIQCYLEALDSCYLTLCDRIDSKSEENLSLTQLFDYFAFHTPYCRLVQKSVARLAFLDLYRKHSKKRKCNNQDRNDVNDEPLNGLNHYFTKELSLTYGDKALEKKMLELSKEVFDKMTLSSLKVASLVGNLYTGSVFASIMSLVAYNGENISNKRVAVFSYGSGLIASMFVLEMRDCGSLHERFIKSINAQFSQRKKMSPQEYDRSLSVREELTENILKNHSSDNQKISPKTSVDTLANDTWYLSAIDSCSRRSYVLKI